MATFTRKGLHKLECQMCDAFIYATVAMLEARGLSTCWCGERLHPTELDLAIILEDEQARPMVEYREQCASIAHGQAPHAQRGHRLQQEQGLAADRVEEMRRGQDRRRRRRVIVEPMPF